MEVPKDVQNPPPEGADVPEDAAAELEYPPDTHRLMSWGSIQFIHRPHPRLLAWACFAVFGLFAAMIIGSFFITIAVRVEASGEVQAYPELLGLVSETNGLLDSIDAPQGTKVAKDQILAVLHLDAPMEAIERVLSRLEVDQGLAEKADVSGGLNPKAVTGHPLDNIRDQDVRDEIVALDNALRRLRPGRVDPDTFENDRDAFINANKRLQNALRAYLEAHRIRSPTAGTVLQYNVGTHARVKMGQVMATILPEGANLVAVVLIDPKDVPSLAVGQPVQHHIDAYPSQRFGLFEGKVLAIDQVAEKSTQEGTPHYQYQVTASIQKPARLSKRAADPPRLMMGMTLSSRIVTDRHTVYEAAMDAFFGRR